MSLVPKPHSKSQRGFVKLPRLNHRNRPGGLIARVFTPVANSTINAHSVADQGERKVPLTRTAVTDCSLMGQIATGRQKTLVGSCSAAGIINSP